MDLAIISDTHVPDRERGMPQEFRQKIAAADHVVHAGDFTSTEMLETVRDLAADLTAVHGNRDGDEIDLPSVASVDCEDVTVVVTHGTTRSLDAWFETVAEAARTHADEPRVCVGGHTHGVEDQVHDGVRLLNPGSVTGAYPAERATMMTATVNDGELDVTVHEA